MILENVNPAFERCLRNIADLLSRPILAKAFSTGVFAVSLEQGSGRALMCDLRLEAGRKAAKRLVVTPQESVLRALVQSASEPDSPHLTDLEEYDGNGQCSCEDFQKRKQPFLERLDARVPAPLFAYECVHIAAHKEWLYRETLCAVKTQLGRVA